MHALHAALSARRDVAGSPAVAELLTVLEQAGPEVTTMDVQISSFGGVGSTQLSNHLNVYGITTNLLTDADTLRHCHRPPDYPRRPVCNEDAPAASTSATAGAVASTSSSTGPAPAALRMPYRPRHVVYLYGDPLAAVASHYRRGHACHQAQKTCGNPAKLSAAAFPATFEDYVDRAEDLFGLEQHFRNWLTAPVDYPITMVRYERMFDADVAGPLFRRLCAHRLSEGQLEAMTAAFIAGKQPRKSQVPPETCGKMYGSLMAEMDELPPLYVRM